MAEFRGVETITFDCSGTLIDWESGLRDVLRRLAGDGVADDAALFDAYLATEAEIEAGPYMSYRSVLAETVSRLGRRFGFHVPDRELPARALPGWRPFPDTNEALRRLKARCRLGMLSNVDRDLLAETAKHLDVDFDFVITAADVKSYKPGHAHFQAALDRADVSPDTWVHAAQSLFHDCEPAGRLGVRAVWINRRNETNRTSARPAATFPTLTALADAVCGAVAHAH